MFSLFCLFRPPPHQTGCARLLNAGLVGTGNQGIYAFNFVHLTAENFGTIRIDHKFSDRDSLFGTYQNDQAVATQPDPNNDVLVQNATGRQFEDVEETHTLAYWYHRVSAQPPSVRALVTAKSNRGQQLVTQLIAFHWLHPRPARTERLRFETSDFRYFGPTLFVKVYAATKKRISGNISICSTVLVGGGLKCVEHRFD